MCATSYLYSPHYLPTYTFKTDTKHITIPSSPPPHTHTTAASDKGVIYAELQFELVYQVWQQNEQKELSVWAGACISFRKNNSNSEWMNGVLIWPPFRFQKLSLSPFLHTLLFPRHGLNYLSVVSTIFDSKDAVSPRGGVFILPVIIKLTGVVFRGARPRDSYW